MTRSWSYKPTQDKLLIFVSSRIKECKEERSVVHDAIRSINHHPVLFEHLGARPYSARDLYLSRLQDSQAMVAIYRSGYGYVDSANGMTISGLEDEYRFAKREGIETIFYVWNGKTGRDSQLELLIDEISKDKTISYYDMPGQLFERVRDDLSSLITEKVVLALSHGGVLQEDAHAVISRTLATVGVVVNRDAALAELSNMLALSPVICVCGDAGIGKTNITAQLANRLGAKFVRASGLAPKDVFGVCADRLRGVASSKPTPYSTLDGARLATAAAWAELTDITLIIDECEYIAELIDAISLGGGLGANKKLVYTSRKLSPEHANFEVPPLTLAEVQTIVASTSLPGKAGAELLSVNNPLVLQNLLMGFSGAPSLDGLNVGGSAKEILTYLALSPIPLSAEQLIELRSDNAYSISSLQWDVEALGKIVDDSPQGYRLIHAETAIAIADEVRKSPQRHLFFLKRLVRLLEESGQSRKAYELAIQAGDGSERQYGIRALREAARLGDWRLGVPLAEKMLSTAVDAESRSEALHLMLSLAYPLELMGNVDRADEILQTARTLATELGANAELMVQEVETSSRARRAMQATDVNALCEIHRVYGERQMMWDQARIGLELSAIYISAKKYELAVDILRPTLASFGEIGDEYGVDLAKRNLASALSAVPGNETETEELIAEIAGQTAEETDERRQRAWMCNVLVRRFRKSGRLDEAEALAKEAIDIGTSLGDESLRAINLINLGNVLKDSKRPKAAIEAYEAAATSARACGRKDVEADSSRLVAGVYNDFEEVGPPRERREKAKHYATHAVALVRGSVNHETLARAFWELGDALEALGQKEDAANALFDAAVSFRIVPDEDAFGQTLIQATWLGLPDYPLLYLKRLSESIDIPEPEPESGLSEKFLNSAVPIMTRAPESVFIRLLGAHLNEIRSNVPQLVRRGLVTALVERFRKFALDKDEMRESWRILYSAIVIASFLKDTEQAYVHYRLASSVVLSVEDVFVREEGDGTRVWTLVLAMKRRVTITIACLDASPATNIASIALAMFVKAFEKEMAEDLIAAGSELDELLIYVGALDEMPADLRQSVEENLSAGDTLTEQCCAVSRPTDFGDKYPTIVFLNHSFLDGISFGEEGGNSLELLFGLTLMEIVFQLLRGKVEMDSIRPKVVSLVKKARP